MNINTPLKVLAESNAPEIMRVFDRQRETALRWRTSSAAERVARIKKLHDAVLDNRDRIREAGYKDFRKPPEEVDIGEILPVISEARDAMRHLGKWMKPTHVMPTRLMWGTRSWIKHEPKGRCLIISPWNYPVNLTFGPLVSCLAAGNTAIVKPSEMTPNLSDLMTKILRELFADNEVAVFQGETPVATALLELPFDHIFFTGSPAVGKIVMAAAAKHLTSVTLELGGKSPTIVDKDADVKLAAQGTVWGKFTNGGQTCIAPDHVFVHTEIKQAFIAECAAALKSAYGETSEQQLNSPMLTRMVNAAHTRRVGALLDDAKSHGARVLAGGAVDVAQCFVQPTLLESMPPDAKIAGDEIFGPVLPIIEFSDLEQVITRINAQPKPLALYVWGKDRARLDQVINNTSSGGVCINNCVVQFLHGSLPFGGVNNSGFGNAHGWYGFRAFSHERPVVRTHVMAARFFFAPYTALTRWILNLMIKIT